MARFWLLLLAVFATVWWLLGGLRRRPAARPAGGSASAASGGRMVRDRVCDTFLPQASALVHHAGGKDHYFCSRACLDRFLASR